MLEHRHICTADDKTTENLPFLHLAAESENSVRTCTKLVEEALSIEHTFWDVTRKSCMVNG